MCCWTQYLKNAHNYPLLPLPIKLQKNHNPNFNWTIWTRKWALFFKSVRHLVLLHQIKSWPPELIIYTCMYIDLKEPVNYQRTWRIGLWPKLQTYHSISRSSYWKDNNTGYFFQKARGPHCSPQLPSFFTFNSKHLN